MFEERFLLSEGVVVEARISDDRDFVLSLRKGGTLLVEYRKASAPAFRSVEKLRYDFQRDAEDALRQD